MELVLLLSTLIQRFVLSVPEGCKLPSGQLSGDALLVQPEQYSLVLHRRTEAFEGSDHQSSTEESRELCPDLTPKTLFCQKSQNVKGASEDNFTLHQLNLHFGDHLPACSTNKCFEKINQ